MPYRRLHFYALVFAILLDLSTAATTTSTLPYNPTRILSSFDDDSGTAYIFRPQSSDTLQFELVSLNVSATINASDATFTTLSTAFPFLDAAKNDTFVPVIEDNGDILVYAGTCDDGSDGAQLWRYRGASWKQQDLSSTSSDDQMGANFLAAGLAFSTTVDANDSSVYVFGGMCPSNDSTTQTWTSNATYSNLMTCISPESSTSTSSSDMTYGVASVSTRGPPVAEAGFAITPLVPTVSNSSSGIISRQQNFIFTGGHTETAFINMSQLAVYSLPEESWSFVTVQQQADSVKTDLALAARGDVTEIEPRSGHTAVLTSDGSQIVVFGGWVGDIGTAASPQLVVLEVAEGYGGDGSWAWTMIDQSDSPLDSNGGIFGHGAVMLPGDVMMVTGGYKISSSTSSKRSAALSSSQDTWLFNVTSKSWVSSYSPPVTSTDTSSTEESSGPLSKTSQKVGLGTGVALGVSSLVGLVVFCLWYRRRSDQKRRLREQELRDLAFGVERVYPGGHDPYHPASIDFSTSTYPPSHKRSRSDSQGDQYPWAPVSSGAVGEGPGWRQNGGSEAERTGLLFDIPSPTRGLRRASHAKPWVYQPAPRFDDARRIDPIDERDEYEARDSGNEQETAGEDPPEMQEIGHSDPFVDPPQSSAGVHRNPLRLSPVTKDDLKVPGLNDDPEDEAWQAKGIRSISPDKDDRTTSSLSERSSRSGISSNSADGSNSIQHSSSGGGVSRSASQRSSNLLNLVRGGPTPDSMASSSLQSQKRTRSVRLTPSPGPSSSLPSEWDRSYTADTFSTAHTSWPQLQAEGEMLLNGGAGTVAAGSGAWYTPPESPTKSSPRNRKMGWLGSVRRALTGRDDAAGEWNTSPTATSFTAYEHHPTRSASQALQIRDRDYYYSGHRNSYAHNDELEDFYTNPHADVPRRAVSASAALLQRKQGARDWDIDAGESGLSRGPGSRGARSHTLSMMGPGQISHEAFDPDAFFGDGSDDEGGDDGNMMRAESEDEWDIETAVQRRSVQVMFTVPKERLRVVNGDLDSDGVSRKSMESGRVVSAGGGGRA